MFNIKLSKISISDLKKYTKFIIIFIVILFLVGGYFLWWPKYQEFQESRIDLSVEGEKIKKKKDYIFELETSLNNIVEYEQEILKINAALPLQYSSSSLFSFIQKTASENGLIMNKAELAVDSSQPTTEAGAIQIDRIDTTVTVRGNYASFKDFLSALYRNSRLVEVERISIAKAKQKDLEAPPTDLFDFDLEIYANYYNKLEE